MYHAQAAFRIHTFGDALNVRLQYIDLLKPRRPQTHELKRPMTNRLPSILPPLDMAELLALLGSLDSVKAGAATAFVEGLDREDPRFQRPYWGSLPISSGEQKKAATGGRLYPVSVTQSEIDLDSRNNHMDRRSRWRHCR